MAKARPFFGAPAPPSKCHVVMIDRRADWVRII